MRTTVATTMKPLNTITAVPLTAVTNQPIVAKTTQQPAVAAAAAVAAGNVFDNMDRQLDFYNHVLLPAAVDDPNSSPQKKQIKNAADLSKYCHQSGPSDWMCVLCLQHFTRGYSLQEHIRVVHLKERPHRCSICPMKFGKRSNMIAHEKLCKQKSSVEFVKNYEKYLSNVKDTS